MTGNKKTAGRIHEIGSGIWLSIATCFMLFLYAPLELLFTNQDEFWFDVYILTPIMFAIFAAACIVSVAVFLVLRKLDEKIYWIGLAVYFIAFLCLYIQGNLLTAGLPSLDGKPIDWSLYTAEKVQSAILWLLVTILVGFAFWKVQQDLFEKVVKGISIGMTLMLCVTLITLAVTGQGFERKPGLGVTTRNMFQMSKDTNFVILLLDAVNGQTMYDIIASDTDYQDIFTDFTFYSNMMGVYPATKYSVPYILSGQWFENQTSFREYEAEAYASSPFLASMGEEGYQLGVYEADLQANDRGKERFENVLPSRRGIGNKLMFAKWQIQMTGFKYAPWSLKKHTFVNPNDFNKAKIPPEGEELFTSSNSEFYDTLLQEELSYTDAKCFRFIHIVGGHPPFIYNEEAEEIPEEEGSYEESIKSSLTITREYLDKLKAGGVYDNSVIIVMSDHGFHMGDYSERQNPIFFVKGINEKHDFNVSDAPVSYVDLQEAYQRLLSGADSDQIFDWKSGEERERRYLFYEYSEEERMIEYMQPGRADDTEAMYETGKVYTRAK